MWRPVLSGLLCLPAVILLFLGLLGNAGIRLSHDRTTDFAEPLPPVRDVVALAISLPATQLSTDTGPELGGWQQVLAEPPARDEATKALEDSTPTADATNGPQVDLVQPAVYVRSKPAHPAQIRSVRATRHKEMVLPMAPPPSEPPRRSQIVWVPPHEGGG
jgi:hypothetical protein